MILSDIQIRSYTGMIIDLQKYERDLNTSTNKLKSSNWNRFNIILFRVSEAVKVQTGQQFTKFQMRNKGICKYICKSKARVYVMKNRAQAPNSIKKAWVLIYLICHHLPKLKMSKLNHRHLFLKITLYLKHLWLYLMCENLVSIAR